MQTKSNQTRGIQLMLIGSMILPFMDAAAKTLGESLGSSSIVLARFVFQTLFLLPFVWHTLYLPRGTELVLHIKRSLGLSVATLLFFTSIQVMPIVDALAVFFVMPLIVTLLAPWILGEMVGWRRIAAVAVGLIGAVLIIKPGHAVFGIHAILPLGTALSFSFYLMYTRKLSRSNKEGEGEPVPAITMQFWSGLIGSIIMLLSIVCLQPLDLPVFNFQWPENWQWKFLVLVGLIAAIGHLVLTNAFKYADASILAPFQYVELIVAAILGWYLFNDIPTLTTVIGTLVLVASGMYIFKRESVPIEK
ncbi:MAG: S-adenosylmethionine uptake transporter [Cocleimonas sp.]|jgi:S-adenosylmethionine uptake transporter